MNEHLKSDWSQIETLLNSIKQQGVDYLNSITEKPTSVPTIPVWEKQGLPESGYGTEETLKIFNQRFEPIIVGSSGPRYLGFVTGGTTPASIAGDWLTTIYDQNTQTTKG